MSQDQTEPQTSALLRRLPLIAILLVAAVGAFTLRDYLSFDTLRDNRAALLAFRDDHYVLTALGFVAAYVVVVAFSLPGATMATLIFLAARHGLGAQLGAKLENSKGVVKRIKDGIDANQWSMLFLIRLVPAVPFFVANLVPAFMQVPLYRFVVSTFFGIMPGAVVYTSVGAGLGKVFARGETPDLGIIFAPHILFPLLGLVALALLPILYKAVTGKKDILK